MRNDYIAYNEHPGAFLLKYNSVKLINRILIV